MVEVPGFEPGCASLGDLSKDGALRPGLSGNCLATHPVNRVRPFGARWWVLRSVVSSLLMEIYQSYLLTDKIDKIR
jgi:hypothetical protein